MTRNQLAPDQLARTDFPAIPRYSTGPASAIDLADNTNQWGTPPAAAAVLRAGADVSRYPDMYGDALKRTVAEIGGVTPECVVTGNGSDDVIDCAIRAFAAPGEAVAHPDPTFVMVPVFSRINSVVPVAVPLTADYAMDADALLATGARIIYLCSPNNPTATPTPVDTIRKVIANARGLVIIDEAYAEFTGAANFLREAPSLGRVLVCRTLSKAYGLAGLRVGYGVGSRAIVETIEKSRGPFKLNAFAERAAVAAMTDDAEWVAARVADAVASRDRTGRGAPQHRLRPAAVGRELPPRSHPEGRGVRRAPSRRWDRNSHVQESPRNRRCVPHHRGAMAGTGTRPRHAGRRRLMRITIFDYGAGNLHSLAKALQGDDRVVRVEPDPRAAIDTDVLFLPGVGAFGAAAQALAPGRNAIRDLVAMAFRAWAFASACSCCSMRAPKAKGPASA